MKQDPRIFITYRREDSAGYAGRLHDALRERIGHDRVFIDVVDIGPGVDFVAAIERAVASATVVIAVIGRQWLDAVDASGRRRLEDPLDYVRIEIATALRQGKIVIPVLVGGAAMPSAGSLPEDLAPLLRREALEVSDTRWDYDADRLAAAITRGAPRGPSGRRLLAGATLAYAMAELLVVSGTKLGGLLVNIVADSILHVTGVGTFRPIMTLHGLLFPMAYAVAGGAVLLSRGLGVRLVGSVALTESVLLIVYTVLASFPFPGSVWIRLLIWGALPLGLSLVAWRFRS